MHGQDVRLKVHVVLETTAGERIAEIRNEHVVVDSFDEPSLRTAEATLARMLEATVLSPARGLIRAHVNKLLERVSFRRRAVTTPSAMPWPEDAGVKTTLEDKLAAIMAKARG